LKTEVDAGDDPEPFIEGTVWSPEEIILTDGHASYFEIEIDWGDGSLPTNFVTIFTDGQVTISQGNLMATADFTGGPDDDGLNAGTELANFAGSDLGSFTDGQVTISQNGFVLSADFIDGSDDGLNVGTELENFTFVDLDFGDHTWDESGTHTLSVTAKSNLCLSLTADKQEICKGVDTVQVEVLIAYDEVNVESPLVNSQYTLNRTIPLKFEVFDDVGDLEPVLTVPDDPFMTILQGGLEFTAPSKDGYVAIPNADNSYSLKIDTKLSGTLLEDGTTVNIIEGPLTIRINLPNGITHDIPIIIK
jgi:hypothetical protein